MILSILNALGPVFLVILLGWALRFWGFLGDAALGSMTRLTYWVGLPCLLFGALAKASPELGHTAALFGVVAGATLLGILISFLIGRHAGIAKGSLGTLIQAVFRGNLAFVGLPIVVYAFNAPGAGYDSQAAETAALVTLGPMVVLYNVVAVLVLTLSRNRLAFSTLPGLLRQIAINPLLLGCLAGVIYSALAIPFPLLLSRTFSAIGQMSLPLALICTGAGLAVVRFRTAARWAIAAGLGKVVMLPLLGYALATLVDLGPDQTRIALIFLCSPTATVSYILVRQIGGDESLASGAILISTLLTGISLAVVLAVV